MTLNPFKPFSSYLKPYRKKIALGLTLLVGSQLASTAIPIFLQWAVDMAQTGYEANQAGNTIAVETALNEVIYYAVYIVLLAILSMLLQMGMRWALNSMARYVEYDMRAAYFDHLLRLPTSFYNHMPTGDLMARATNDIQAIRMFLAFGVRMIVTAALAFPLSLVVMATIDWKLAIYAILPMPLLALVMNRVAAKINVGFRDIQEQFSTISARIQENLAGIRVVKAFVRREQEIEVFKHLNEDYLQKNKVLINVQSLFYPFMFLISGASLLIVLWIGGGEIIRDEMTLGEFVAFNAYLTRLVFPMITLGWMIDRYQRGVASMKRINAVLETKPEITNIPEAKKDVDIKGHIEFRHLHFDYDKTPILNDINLVIPAGSTLAVVGRVGAGKTTLANLIPRMIEPAKGDLLIDGIPIRTIDLSTLRAAIGFVPQDTFLFSDTIFENVAMGIENATATEVSTASEISQLSKDMSDFPDGFDTMMGERGVTLSGGQKQRTALARAVIRNPKILILDDAMASVDTHTEDEILDGLRKVMADRTTIIIAHRISTVKDADHIIVLDEGRIVEQGTHDTLIHLNGIYTEMYQQQQMRDELGEM